MSLAQAVPLLIVAFILGGVATWWFVRQQDAPGAGPTTTSGTSTKSSTVPSSGSRRELLEAAGDKVADENRQLREKVSSLNGRIKKLEGRAGKVDREIADAERLAAAATAKVDVAENALADALAEHEATRTELRTLHGQQAATPAVPEEPEVDAAALESAAEEARRSQHTAEDRLAKVQADIDAANRSRRDAEKERDEARKLFDQANRERGAAREEITTLRAKLGMPAEPESTEVAPSGSAPRRVTQLTDEEARRMPRPPGSGEATSGPDTDDDDDDEDAEPEAPGPNAGRGIAAIQPAVEDVRTPETVGAVDAATDVNDESDPTEADESPKPAGTATAPAPAYDGAPVPAVTDEDELTRINGVDARTAKALRNAGIGTYRALSMASTDAVDGALDRAGIEEYEARPTWARQAARLADGDERGFAALTKTLADEADETEASGDAPVDLTRIEGIGPKINVVLRRGGITSFEELAQASVDEIVKLLGEGGVRFAPSKETWAQQAQLLVDGDEDGFKALTDQLASGR